MIPLETPIANVPGVGPTYAQKLLKLNIITVGDLIHHYPHRYDDYAAIKNISNTQVGEEVTIVGSIWDIGNVYTKSHKILTKAVINDGTGAIEVVWFNQRYLGSTLKTGMRISLSGKVSQNGYKLNIVSPVYEILQEEEKFVNTGRLVPVYPETAGVSSRWLRGKVIRLLPATLESIEDWLPEKVQTAIEVLPLQQAISQIHFPNTKEEMQAARKRIAYDELLKVHLTALKRKYEWQTKTTGTALKIDQKAITQFIHGLPFPLTSAQQRVIDELLFDLSQKTAMNRLLEGDVGSGKTVVAAVAMYATYLNKLQSAIMAPTAILARQHYETLTKLLEPFGITVDLVTGATKRQTTDDKQQAHVIVGTHALVAEGMQFENLGFVVVDEQHKFGVEQRALLRLKGNSPHVLTMTATPIPRTLALTLYGNLDLSIIDEMPKGRTVVKTYVTPQKKRTDAYKFIEKEIRAKQVQAFIVCPLIEESETYATAKAATVEYERLSKEIFPKLKLGLLHGRMKTKEKDDIMTRFANRELDILVSTPLVEVGVDIPNATIMLIEAADRFGLAQLHQLRGRVGRRAGQEAYCLLFTELTNPTALRRLKAMEKIYNGAELAELDLQYRGAGELFGTKQHGIPDFKVAKLSNLKLIEETRQIAQQIFTDYYLKGNQPLVEAINSFDQKLIEPN